LDEDETGLSKVYIRSENGVNQQREVAVVNESGLYALIMRSNKPAARKFRKWVTSEVLPAIRQQGFYVHPDLMDKKQARQINAGMLKLVERYLTDDDIAKVCKKFGVSTISINYITKGHERNNAIMQELQRRALVNKEAEVNAYDPERMQKIIQKLIS
jgi:prophage antirepressor-like protein